MMRMKLWLALVLALTLALGLSAALAEDAPEKVASLPEETPVEELEGYELAAPEGDAGLPGEALGKGVPLADETIETGDYTIEDGVLVDWASDPSVRTLMIPDNLGITAIGNRCFANEVGLQVLILPAGVKRIEAEAFSGCSGLTQLYFPDDVEYIGTKACNGCVGLQSMTIPKNVVTIGDNAFESCIGLRTVTFEGQSLETIGRDAFSGCAALEAAILPDSVKTIDWHAFAGLKNLKTLYLGKSLETIGHGAFGETGITTVTIPGTVRVMDGGNVYYPWGAFVGCADLETVVIEEGATVIGPRAFEGCGKLKSVTVPGSVLSIAYRAFVGCESLEQVTITGEGLETIDYDAFSGCKSLRDIALPESLKSIASNAFRGDASLTSVRLGHNLASIGSEAFRDTGLTSLTIPGTINEITEWDIFSGCASLESVVVESGVTKLNRSIFGGCASLKSVTLPNGLTVLGESMFAGCSALEHITLPKTLTSIGRDILNGCASLISVYVYEGSFALQYCIDNELPYEILQDVPVGSVTLDHDSLSLTEGQSAQLTATVLPEGVVDKSVLWKSSDNKVATVVNGLVTAVAKGSATITCISMSDVTKTATCEVTVTPESIPVTGIKLSVEDGYELFIGKSVKIKATLEPEGAEGTIVWRTSNKKVATVKDGKVTGVKKGKVKISATAANGVKAVVTIQVVPPQPKRVSFESKSITLGKKQSVTLKPVLKPDYAQTTYTWESSNSKVAKVNKKGRVTGVKKGTATITVTTANGKKAKIKVIVQK